MARIKNEVREAIIAKLNPITESTSKVGESVEKATEVENVAKIKRAYKKKK